MTSDCSQPARSPRKRPRVLRVLLVSLAVLVLVGSSALAYSMVWGKLLPYSPVVLGFARKELAHVVLYTQHNNPYDGFEWADELIPGVEEFHGLTFKWKPKLFFFGDADTYARRSLSKARLCAFYNGAIVVSPWVQREDAEGLLSLRVYLTHELSHSLLCQQMGMLANLRYPRWLLEGIATYSAKQMGTFVYPSREQTHALIRRGNWMPPDAYATDAEDGVQLAVKYRMTFIYSEFACIVDDLIARFGRDSFLRYMKRLLAERDHDAVFSDVFGIDFHAYLADLRTRIEAADPR